MKCTTYARALTVAIAATVGFAAAAAAAPPDHYFCYQAKDSKSPLVQPKFPKEFVPQTAVKDVQLIDQFGTRFYDIVKYTNFCNPTEKTYQAQSFPPAFPAVHLAETQIKLNKNPANTKFVKTNVTSFDQFFSGQPLQLSAPAWLRVRASKVDGGALQKCKENPDCTDPGETCQNKVCLPNPFDPPASPPANNVGIDNFVCYKAKQLVKQPVVQAEFEDQFNPGAPRLYDIKKLTKFCVPADKNGENPGAESNPGHLTCYQAKIAKTDPKQSKFPVHTISINTVNFSTRDLQAAKEVEVCLPATATTATAPTMLVTTTEAPGALSANNPVGGACGSITPGPVPNRVDPLNPLADPDAACVGAGNPSPCCSGAGAGTCNDGNTITCGSLQFGGGHGQSPSMPNMHFLQASGEVVSLPGSKTNYNLACTSWTDPACALSGKVQDVANSIAGSTVGSSGVTPISTAGPPLPTCAIQTLRSLIPGQYASDCRGSGQPYPCCTAVNTGATCDPEPAPSSAISGNVDLNTGAYTLAQETRARVWLFQQCPVCQDNLNQPAVGTGGTWGVGTCATGANVGGTCYVRTSDVADAGKSADCPPSGSPSVPDLLIPTTQSTAGASATGPGGLFCPGPPGASQDNNGAGSDVRGCFDSSSAAECTSYSIIGSPAGPLGPTPKHALTGAAGCIPSVGALLDDATGLPGPVGVSVTTNIEVQP